MNNLRDLHVLMLEEEYKKRKSKSPLYSLRAFARDIGLHPSSLSQVLKSNRKIPIKTAQEIAQKLRLSADDTVKFLESNSAADLLNSLDLPKEDTRHLIDDHSFKVVAELDHYALLSLFDTKSFKGTVPEILQKLDVSESRARELISNLLAAGLIEKEGVHFRKAHSSSVKTSEDIVKEALRQGHLATLELGKEKLEQIPVELRDFSEVTMAVSISSVPALKQIIREFRQKVLVLAAQGDRSEVYQMAIQLYPMTKIGGEHEI